ncbi:MAG: non-ribosomal peptide synthetase [Janthinobacterium lividum]
MDLAVLSPPTQVVDFDPFGQAEIALLVPLTASQAEIWLACQLGGDDASRAYNESVSLRLHGALHVGALRTALTALTRRHEALRATCSADGTVLCVLDELATELTYYDLAATAEPGPDWRARALRYYATQEAQHVFDLVQGPLWRASLLKLAEGEFNLTLTAHHVICDGWSLGLLLQDLSALYSAAMEGREPGLPAATPFSEYAEQEAAFQTSAAYGQTEQYWRAAFRHSPPTLRLPTDFERPSSRTYKSRRLDYALDPALVAGLRTVGRRAGTSFVTTLLAVFEVLLHKLTGQDDLVVGLPAAGQSAAGLSSVVGHCVNLLPLRSHPSGPSRFEDYLRTRKTELFDALEHQQLTFGHLLTKLPLRREAGHLPLVAVLFNVDLGFDEGVAFAGLTHELHSNPRAFENFELSLNASGNGNQLVLECSYNVALFQPERIERLLAGFARLAEQVVANPATLLADLQLAVPILPEAYLQLNDTQTPYPATATLPGLISAQALATPTKTAVKFGATELSYAELDQQANQLAASLQARLQPGDVVAVALERTPSLLVALLAVLKCGAAYLPLDPSYPSERLEFMLNDSGARLLLTSAGGLPSLATGPPRLLLNEALAEAAALGGLPPTPFTRPDDLCYILYTSGSTGQPKGVAVTHRNLVNFLTSMRQAPGITADDKLLAITTISFDIAGLELFLPLVSGATVVLADAYSARDGRALLHLLEAEQITMLQATPSTWQLLLAAGWEKPLPLVALCGGEPLPLALAQSLLSKCAALWNMYGPTETTIWSAVRRIEPDAPVITVGRPIANTQLYVLNALGEPVVPGTSGELYIGGVGVARGYWQRPALTAQRFVNNPFALTPGATMYRTGDAAVLLATGEVQLQGRLDEQLKLRGHRIEPGEIEAHLTRLDDIRQAVVVAQERTAGDERLVAYLMLDSPATDPAARAAQRASWQLALHAHLPTHLVPSEFVVLDALPLLPNGKIDRPALRQRAAAPITAAVGFVPPRTNVEQLVADSWCEALKITEVGVFDDFFDLGGHSLIAVQVMARLEKVTGKRLPLAALFTHPTVAALALLIQRDGSKAITWDSLVPIKPKGTKTPLYIVHGAGMNVLLFNALARNMDADQPIYGLQARGLNGVDEPLDRIEDMAAHYVAAIRAQNPEGPYALAGFSFGGLIAFEMAKQLLAIGKKVQFLAMFDTYAYQSNYRAPRLTRLTQNTLLSFKKTAYTLKLLASAPGPTLAYQREQLRFKVGGVLGRLGLGTKLQSDFGYPPLVDWMNEIAWRRYVLTPAPVAIELFRANHRTFYMPDAELLGWQPFALNGITVHSMPGAHNFMFAPPHDQHFAAVLQARLDNSAR